MNQFDLPLAFYAALAFIFGLVIGSFLNVVIHRVPQGLSVVFPRSRCAECGVAIRAFDNIPLLGFAILRGRCRSCRARISFVYPAVELLTALMFVALTLKTGPSWDVLTEFAFACAMIALVVIDARYHWLPNVITYPAFVFALAAAAARAGWGEPASFALDISIIIPGFNSEFEAHRAALIGGSLLALAAPGFWLLDRLDSPLFDRFLDEEEAGEEIGEAEAEREMEIERRHNRAIRVMMIIGLLVAVAWAATMIFLSPVNQRAVEEAYGGLLRASAGALIGGGFLWWLRAVHLIIRRMEGMGLGDVKMVSVVGAFLGWQGALGGLLLGSILGSAVGLILAYRRKSGFKTRLPFGVCFGIAALIVMLTATPFFRWYVGL